MNTSEGLRDAGGVAAAGAGYEQEHEAKSFRTETITRREMAMSLLGALGLTTLAGCDPGQSVGPPAISENFPLTGLTNLQWTSSISELRSYSGGTTSSSINVVVVRGYSMDGDGGGGVFAWTGDTSTADDGGVVIVPSGTRTGCWKRLCDGTYNVKWFGATGDGSTNDQPAIQAAVGAACVSGGAVYFPVPGRYKINSTITVSSLYPVSLISNMNGFSDNLSTASNFIMPGANFGSNSMIQYVAPGASHGAHGAGLVRGLSFYDPYSGNHTPYYTMLAALDLTDFTLGRVEDCYFHVLNGGAIRTIYAVMASLKSVEVRYCGTTGTGAQAAISLESSSANVNTQSFSILDSKIEANYGTYLKLDSNSNQVKVSHCGFEAYTPDATTCNTFIDNSGQHNFFSDIHLNQNNNVTQFVNQSASNFALISNICFYGNNAQTSAPAMTIDGANHNVSNISVSALIAQTGPSINIIGAFITMNNVNISTSGGISISGNAFVEISNIYINDPPSGSGSYAVEISSSHCKLVGGIIRQLPTNMGGVRVSGAAQTTTITGVEVDDVSGTGVAFRDENSSNRTQWLGNSTYNCIADFSWNNTTFEAANNNWQNTLQTIPWIAPSLLNSWVYFGSKSVPGYYKDANGWVHIRGFVKNGSSATATVFQLPAGYRPLNTTSLPIALNGAVGYIDVSASTGNVTPQIGSTAGTYLDGISFPAEQ